ncbi:hypothetical protein [Pseudomarimonas arenosa]|uniref:Uncharacterized protein n=1 Tax=Pseudomarimonas arenosa TaxID=2774145 RepID=A0AAW3ZNY0_9GAMM|nr:hypothetical protein [Pseudomarimonas arenosa]MBD8526630.1 hypothetical protein [Pseudomarimonas arenosa]
MALLLLSSQLAAEPMAYGVGFRDLYRLDLGSGQFTLIGPVGYNDIEGLALDSGGQLLGAVDASAGSGGVATDFLIRINSATGQGNLIGQLSGLAGLGPEGQLDYGLAFTCDNRLWLSSETGELWEVNRGNAEVRRVGSTGAALSGLAGRGEQLYGVSVGNNAGLYRIDRDSAAATLVGALGVGGPNENVGLDFDASGVLWAVLDPRDASRPTRVARVDLQTGAATVVSTINHDVGMKGLAIAPVAPCSTTPGGQAAAPEAVPVAAPWVLWLIGVVTVAVGARRLRQTS